MIQNRRFSLQDYYEYIEGELSQRDATALEAHVAENRDAQRCLGSVHRVVDTLTSPLLGSSSVDLVASINARIDEEHLAPGLCRQATRPRFKRRARAVTWSVTIASIAAGIALWLLPVSDSSDADDVAGWRAKSSGTTSLAGIEIHRQTPLGAERVFGDIRRDDQLSIAYRNLGDPAFDYLMVFGVAPSGRIYWYYPAYTDLSTDPVAIGISGNKTVVALPEFISHDLEPGPLAIYAVFSRSEIRVSRVEAMAPRIWRAGRTHVLPFPADSVLQQVRVVDVQ